MNFMNEQNIIEHNYRYKSPRVKIWCTYTMRLGTAMKKYLKVRKLGYRITIIKQIPNILL